MSWISDTWITATDFDKFNFPANSIDNFTAEVESSVNEHLKSLLGIELYQLFFDNFENELKNPVFSSLRDGEIIQKDDGNYLEYQGLKEMCQLFIMYNMYKKPYAYSILGIVSESGNNEDKLSIDQQISIANDLYSQARAMYFNSRVYLKIKKYDYPAWKYKDIEQKRIIRS